MLDQGMFVMDNRFGTVHRYVESYRETDLMDGTRYTVVVLEGDNENFAIAENIFKTNYTILEHTKELQIKLLQLDYKKYRSKYDSLELAAMKQLKETGVHYYHGEFDNMGYWESDLLERAEHLGVQL